MAIERAGIDKRSESIFEVKNKFSKLNADDQVFANLRFCIQTLYKYYLEPFYEATLDNTDTLKMNANMGQYPFSKGGVDYYNRMFPDQIDNNDDQSFERKTDSDGLNYVSFSIAEAWAKWGKGNIGDFIVPPEILAYVRKSRQDEEFGEKNIPGDAKRFEEAKEVAEELVGKYKMPSQSVIGIMGALWVECAWAFRETIVNVQEKNNGGVKGTGGWAGAGECWFGLTFWEQKKIVINAIDAPSSVPRNRDDYNTHSATHLANLDWHWQCKILYVYFDKVNKKWGKIICDNNGDPGEQICASYIFKAGHGTEPTLREADRTARIYMKSHKEVNKVANPINGFACQVYVSMKFALYIKNCKEGKKGQDAVPSNKEVDKMLGL